MNLKTLAATMLIATAGMTAAINANSWAIFDQHAKNVLDQKLKQQNELLSKQIHQLTERHLCKKPK